MMWRDSYDLGTIISAIISLVVVVMAVRVVLYLANRKHTQIQKPDWLDDERFDMQIKKKRK